MNNKVLILIKFLLENDNFIYNNPLKKSIREEFILTKYLKMTNFNLKF